MAKNETDSGLFVALNYFSHLPLCLSEKIRRCFKSFDNLEKTSDFFRSLAETDYHYCGVRPMLLQCSNMCPGKILTKIRTKNGAYCV